MSDRPDRPAVSLQWQRLVDDAFANIDERFLTSFRAAGPLNRFVAWNPYEPSTRYLRALLYAVSRQQSEEFFDAYRAIGDTTIGGPPGIRCRGCDINADYLAAVEEFLFLRRHGGLDGAARIVEIGAGFGRTCHALLRLAPSVREYTIVDLPAMLSLSRAYLERSIPDMIDRVRFVSHEDVARAGIAADLSINIDSFQEMPPAAIDEYMDGVVANTVRFYTRNPIAKFDPAAVGLEIDVERLADVFALGYCRARIDVFDEAALDPQRQVFVDAYRPAGFSVAATAPMDLFPYYQHALYARVTLSAHPRTART